MSLKDIQLLLSRFVTIVLDKYNPRQYWQDHWQIHYYIDELVQERCNSSALAIELCLSCTNYRYSHHEYRRNSIVNALELCLSCTNHRYSHHEYTLSIVMNKNCWQGLSIERGSSSETVWWDQPHWRQRCLFYKAYMTKLIGVIPIEMWLLACPSHDLPTCSVPISMTCQSSPYVNRDKA